MFEFTISINITPLGRYAASATNPHVKTIFLDTRDSREAAIVGVKQKVLNNFSRDSIRFIEPEPQVVKCFAYAGDYPAGYGVLESLPPILEVISADGKTQHAGVGDLVVVWDNGKQRVIQKELLK